MRVAALHVYPVKACRALARDEATLGPLGLEGDRRFAFVGDDGRALTQREVSALATVCPVLDAGALRLDLGGLAQLAVSLASFTEGCRVDVWETLVPARAAPRSLVSAAADYLGLPLRLVMLDPRAERAFVDSRPVLVTTTQMLEALGLPGVGMERFRPNVVLEGAQQWTALEGDEVVLRADKPCGRCEVTTIDQSSGMRRGPEPLRTLTERYGGNFGVYCRVARAGRLRRGERLRAS
jgi:MOSC domain-containing protein